MHLGHAGQPGQVAPVDPGEILGVTGDDFQQIVRGPGHQMAFQYIGDARHFALRIVPDLAFVAGLPARLLAAQDEDDEAIPLVIATLGSCVREGCDSPENLATRLTIGRSVSRVAARTKYEELLPYFQDREPNEPFEVTMDRYQKASALSQFSEP